MSRTGLTLNVSQTLRAGQEEGETMRSKAHDDSAVNSSETATIAAFFDALFGQESGILALHSGKREGGRLKSGDQFYDWPTDRETVVRHAAELGEHSEVYVCAHLLTKRKRRRENAAPLRLLYSDVDEGDLNQGPEPTIVVETSPGRTQAYWRLTEAIDPARGEALNKRLAVAIKADASGYDLTQILRVPGTTHQRRHNPVQLVKLDGPTHDPAELERTLPVAPATSPNGRAEPIPQRIREGERDKTLTSLAGSMRRRGSSEEAIYAALTVENDLKCDPPLDGDDLRKIARSVGRYEARTSEQAQAAPVGLAALVYSAAGLMTRELGEMRWAVEGLLPEGLTMLAGRPKIGKSWLALNVALAVASGRLALDVTPEPGDVLCLALEDNPRRLQKRINILTAAELRINTDDPEIFEADFSGLPSLERLTLANRWPRLDQGGLALLEEWLQTHPQARLIVIDTLQRVKPRVDRGTSYEEDYAAMAPLQELALRYQVAILVLHHLRKAEAEDILDLINGSMGMSGVLDGALILQRQRGQMDASLFITGREVEHERTLGLSWNSDKACWSVVGNAEELKLSAERAEVLAVLQTANNEPMTAQAVADILGKPRGTVKRLLWALTQDGHAESVSNKGYLPAATGQDANHSTHPTPTDLPNHMNHPYRAHHTNHPEPSEPATLGPNPFDAPSAASGPGRTAGAGSTAGQAGVGGTG